MVKLTTHQIALIAIFAALYYILSLITPYVPAVGLPELKINLEALIASVFGLVLGPYLGFSAAFMGAIVAWLLPPGNLSPLGLPFLLAPAFNALVVGLIYYKKWKYAFLTFGVLIVVFPLLPPSQPLTEYGYVSALVIWDKIIALALIVPSAIFAKRLSSPKLLMILYFLLAFIGNQADNMWGADAFAVPVVYNGIYALDLATTRFLFTVSPLIYPAIRIIQAIVATIIAVPLIATLKNTGWIWQENSIID